MSNKGVILTDVISYRNYSRAGFILKSASYIICMLTGKDATHRHKPIKFGNRWLTNHDKDKYLGNYR